MLTRIILTLAGAACLIAAACTGNARQQAYNNAEAAYFECLRDLPREECVTILN